MANPKVTFTGTIDGVWFMAYNKAGDLASEAWVLAKSPSGTRQRSGVVVTVPSREEKVSRRGVLHLEEGTVSGKILTRHGLSAAQWLDRLTDLIAKQHRYTVYLVSPRLSFPVELGELTKTPVYSGGPAWDVSVPYRQLAR